MVEKYRWISRGSSAIKVFRYPFPRINTRTSKKLGPGDIARVDRIDLHVALPIQAKRPKLGIAV